MHVCKENMEEETAFRYARALGIGKRTSDNKSWADENERALKNKIRNGRRNSNYFNDTQDFWTNFAIRGVNDKADGLEEISRINEINWMSSLKKNSKEPYNVMKTMNNLKRILENDPSLNEVLLYNEFTGMIEKGATPPWENRFNRQWSDDDVAGLRLYLSENYDIEFGRENLFDVILSVAKDNSYHPVDIRQPKLPLVT